jgi:DNA-binding transcriptional LysR family regulator
MYEGLSLFRLHVFATVVDKGGYSAAAAALDLSQPSVSFHVRSLQKHFGARLLVYRERGVHLTSEGEEVYRTARAMLRDAERLRQTVQHLQEGQQGRLQVGASMAFEIPAYFERVLAPFHRAHPRVHLSMTFGHSVRLAEAVRDHALDFAYVLDWRLPSGVHHEKLHEAEFVFMVAPHHPLARRAVVSPAAITEAGIISAPVDSLEWANYSALLRASGVVQPRVNVEVDGIQARVLAAQSGLGVLGMFVPPYAEDATFAPLVRLRLGQPPPRAQFSLVSRDRPQWTPVMEAFATWLGSVVADGQRAPGRLP